MKISNEMVEQAYLLAKKVYNHEAPRNDAKFQINSASGMEPGSAQDYITVFLAMLDGQEYRRTINTYATKYYLENIKKDFGIETLKKALNAVDKHVKYYKTLGKGSLKSIENILKEFKDKYSL